MFAYVIKRLLIMIPTFVGVSLVIWLVISMAPGEPRGESGRGSFGEDASQDLENRERENSGERAFREQFGLNRPRFFNSWTGLDKAEVLEEITIRMEGVVEHGAGRVKKAERRLEDWGNFAIPPLVELLNETEGDVQSNVLYHLQISAFQFKRTYPSEYIPTPEDVDRDRKIDAANRRLTSSLLTFKKSTPRSERANIVANWNAWFEEQSKEGRWSYLDSFWERAGIAVADTQFGRYWKNLVTFDLGLSLEKKPVAGLIWQKLRYSLSLAVPSFILAWIIAVFLGVTGAANHNTKLDQGLAVGLFMLYSIPSFLMATVLQHGLAAELGWFPVSGFETQGENGAWWMNAWDHFLDILKHLALPLFCYTYGSLAYISRQARSGMLEVLKSDYVRTARAKGVKESTVLWKHAVRNGMMPLITMLGAALPILLAGSVVIEYIFRIDGFGLLMINAVFQNDYNIVMGVSLISAALTLVGLLIADLLYAAVDPRVSYE